jgi:hypothetical protein
MEDLGYVNNNLSRVVIITLVLFPFLCVVKV